MKLLMVILLSVFTGLAQAYSVMWDLSQEDEYSDFTFVGDENIVTWGRGNALGEGAEISYAFAGDTYGSSPVLSANYQKLISKAFGAWTDVANLKFKNEDMDKADIVVAYRDIPNVIIDGSAYNVLGEASVGAVIQYDPEALIVGNSYLTNKGVFFDIKDFTVDSAFSLFSVALHEVGHALGLGHSGMLDSIMYPVYSSTIGSLQADDIAGIQYLYGEKVSFNSAVSVVPEPSIYLLFLLGLAMVVGIGRKRVGIQKVSF